MSSRTRNAWRRRLDRAQRRMERGIALSLKREFALCAAEGGQGRFSEQTHRRRVQSILFRWWLATAQGARIVADDMLDATPASRDEVSREDVAKVLAILAAGLAANADVPAVVALLEAQPGVVAAAKAALVANAGNAQSAAQAVAALPSVSEPLAAAVMHVAPAGPRPLLPAAPPAPPQLPAPQAGPPRLPPPATPPPAPPAGTPPTPPSWDELIAQKLKEQAGTRARKIAQGTQRQVSQILEQAARDGLGEEAARKRLEQALPDLSAARIRTIARTEINAAQNAALVVSADARGQAYRREWLSIDDERRRDSHLAADGQVVGPGEKFRVGEALLDHPGDPSGPPGEIINCRCTMLLLPA